MAYQPEPPTGSTLPQTAREFRRIADELARLLRLIESLDARITALEAE